MQFSIKAPTSLHGTISLPPSKSLSNRALILNALSGGGSTISNLAECDDTNVMVKALNSRSNLIDIGAAGTSMRFLAAYYALQPGTRVLTGTKRMKKRPIRILVDSLRTLGADINYAENEGFPPLNISGKALEGGVIEVDGSISSQFLSALMMIGPKMKKGLTLHINGVLISKPYAKMTLMMMETYGVKAEWIGNDIRIPAQDYRGIPIMIESDWSAASYWYEMLCLVPEGEIFLKGLLCNSLQGDAKGAVLFEQLGIQTIYCDEGVKLTKTNTKIESFVANLSDQPDLAQTFALTCALKNIPFKLNGLKSLKIKETNRIQALINEGRKIGYVFRESSNDTLEWSGEHCEQVSDAVIETYEDHRMAMAFAPVALTQQQVTINHPEVVSKSYPTYWNDLKTMGYVINAH